MVCAFKVRCYAVVGIMHIIFIRFAEDVTRIVESEVRDVEAIIRTAYPEAAYIELEPDSKRTFETAVQGIHENSLRELEKKAVESAIKKVAEVIAQKVTETNFIKSSKEKKDSNKHGI
jgi:hypothetical protein